MYASYSSTQHGLTLTPLFLVFSGIGLNDKLVSALNSELYIWNTDGTNRATIPVPKGELGVFGVIHALGNVCDIDMDSDMYIYISVSKCICLSI